MTVSPSASRRLDFVDLLRGCACLWVVFYHAFGSTQVPHTLSHLPQRALLLVSRYGFLGVSVFLTLSGFCLFYPLLRRTPPGQPLHLPLRTFAARRARRILPPYYAALLILVVLARLGWHVETEAAPDAANVTAHLCLVHNLRADWLAAINPVFWSLALEAQLYVVFPLFVWLHNRAGVRWLAAGMLLISCAWENWAYATFPTTAFWPQTAVWYYALPGRAFEFVAGMAAAYWVTHPAAGQARRGWIVWVGASVLALWGLHMPVLGSMLYPLWGVGSAGLVVALSGVRPARFTESRVLSWGVWVGAISYSIYLVHLPVFRALPSEFILKVLHLPPNFLLPVLVRVVLAVAAGYVFHRLFERPFMPGRPKTERQTETAAAASPAP